LYGFSIAEQLEKQASIIEESAVQAFRDGDFRHADELKLAARSLRWQARSMRAGPQIDLLSEMP
jgi:hypothetical protein